jgi:D-3-phosphoglycerate dehydrogenase
LQVIASLRANPVNVDLTAASDHGIVVLYTPGRNSQAVAELTLCLILDLLRHVSAAYIDMSNGRWGDKEDDPYLRFRGNELQGRTVGILGLGEIGRAVAHLLSGFDINLLAYDPLQPPAIFEKARASKVDLHTLFGSSDIVTLHAPLNDQTRSIVNVDLIRKMRPGAVLVNTARAHLIERDALANALRDGQIGGVAFDVFYEEPPSLDDPILSLPNVLYTPHIGGATREVIAKGSKMVISDLSKLLKGEKPLHAAVYPKGNLRFSASQ